MNFLNSLIKTLANSGPFKVDLDYHLVRASMVSSSCSSGIRRRLAMDCESLRRLARLPPAYGRSGRVQRQINV